MKQKPKRNEANTNWQLLCFHLPQCPSLDCLQLHKGLFYPNFLREWGQTWAEVLPDFMIFACTYIWYVPCVYIRTALDSLVSFAIQDLQLHSLGMVAHSSGLTNEFISKKMQHPSRSRAVCKPTIPARKSFPASNFSVASPLWQHTDPSSHQKSQCWTGWN